MNSKHDTKFATFGEIEDFVKNDNTTQKHFYVSRETYKQVKEYMLNRYDDIEPVERRILDYIEKEFDLHFDEMYFRDLVCPNKHVYTFHQFILDAFRKHGDFVATFLKHDSSTDSVVIGVNNNHPHYCHVCTELVNAPTYNFSREVKPQAKECAYVGIPYGCIRF